MHTDLECSALVPAGECRLGLARVDDVPLRRPGSAFASYVSQAFPLTLLSCGLGIAVTLCSLVAVAGLGNVILTCAWTAMVLMGFGACANRLALIGNRALADTLRLRLGPAHAQRAGEEFVGLCRPENNRPIKRDTDDNVGLLRLTDQALLIRTEEGVLEIPRGDVRQVTREPLSLMQVPRWIAIEYYQDTALRRILVVSRDGDTYLGIIGATDALYERLVAWYLEPLEQELLPAAK